MYGARSRITFCDLYSIAILRAVMQQNLGYTCTGRSLTSASFWCNNGSVSMSCLFFIYFLKLYFTPLWLWSPMQFRNCFIMQWKYTTARYVMKTVEWVDHQNDCRSHYSSRWWKYKRLDAHLPWINFFVYKEYHWCIGKLFIEGSCSFGSQGLYLNFDKFYVLRRLTRMAYCK